MHCHWVLIDDKHLNRLICLGYWRTKQWKCLVWTKEAKANMIWWKVCEADDVREYFINTKIENEAFG